MRQKQSLSDLPSEVFLILRSQFFGSMAQPKNYELRDKRNTQDDPFDEYVDKLLSKNLAKDTKSLRASDPLISPDLVIMRPNACKKSPRESLAKSLKKIVGLEVKKLERQKSGSVARSSGMDYNTTPPCGTIRVYDRDGSPLDIRGFYLYGCQEADSKKSGLYSLSALTLCDGNLLNADFDYYLSIVGQRRKEIGLGTYGNGMNRVRPMLIFANPLGVSELDHSVTLVHSRDDLDLEFPQLQKAGIIRRSGLEGTLHPFYCYCHKTDIPPEHQFFDLQDPFPTPTRTEATQPRGQFRLDIRPGE